MNKLSRVVATRSFESAVKKLKKDHKTKVLDELYDAIVSLMNLKITSQKSNHPLKNAEGHKDLHLDGGKLILLYRYDEDDEGTILFISLRLQDVVNHDQLKNYSKYNAPAHEYDINNIKSSTEFYTWYDQLPEESQWNVDDIADSNSIPLYEEASDEELEWLKNEYINRYVRASEDFETYEDEIKEIDQEFTSENTSINSGKVPAVFKMVSFEPGTINLDFGGGRFNTAAEYLVNYDVINLVYDPYNRSKEHNSEVLQTIRKAGGADTATCSNVLNVIKEPEVRRNVLENIKKLVKPSGHVYITVYEGSGKGDEGPTKAGYQLNKKTADYLEEIQEVFPDAKRKGKLISATNSGGGSMTIKSSTYSYGGAYDIEDDMFFNKEEIVEWANEIVDEFNNTNDELFDVDDVYFTDTTHVVLEISNGDLALNASVNIDMRKIRKPSDLSKYTEEMLYQLQSGYDEFYSYGIESCDKITSASEYDVPDRELEPPAEAEYLEQADSQDEIEIDLPDILVTVDEDGDIDYADDDFDWIKSVDFASNEYSELMLDDWDGAADRILELVESSIPAAKGTYKLSGYVTLVYDITGVESEVTDTWENEEGGQETWEETYTDNAECTFNFRASSVHDLVVEEV